MGRHKFCATNIILTILLIIISSNLSSCKVSVQTDSVCSSKDTCGSCIQEPGCTWCSKQNYTTQRCMTLATHITNQCPSGQLMTPKTSVEIVVDEPLRKALITSSNSDAVQIRPQQIRAHLRVGEEIRFRVQYQQAQDYPIDLYYLMDLSASMEDDKEKLSRLASRLAKVMSNITDNFRLGFGSFVDKTAHPYINTSPGKVVKPCTLQSGKACAPPYSFRHHLSLTSEHDEFEREVRRAPVSGNLDTPEGGMDALVQVLVCSDLIGWRRKARKLILYATDSGFHMAGDGKLGGVVRKNDLKCHMNRDGMYTHALEQDYPSISQINSLAKEHNVNIIFAVAGRSADIYSSLKDAIHGAAYGMLTKDSSNVVDLVRAEYDKIVDSVTLSDNSDEYVSVKYYSRCNSTGGNGGDSNGFGELKETKECGGLKGREVVEFEIAVTAVRCPPGGSSSRKVDIKPQAVDESVTLDLAIACDCDCERPGNGGYIENAPECSGVGSSRCGVCQCPSGRHGRHCECDVSGGDSAGDISDDTSGCIPPGSNGTAPLCSNHGACRCNKCSCHPRRDPAEIHYGTYCECDNFSCPRSATSSLITGSAPSGVIGSGSGGSDVGGVALSGNKAVCGGPSRGRCDCGRCKCLAGWTGEACECPVSKDGCIDPETGLICSGRGECVCGRCECSSVSQTSSSSDSSSGHKYSGKYCSECSSCPSLRCDELRHCVECKAYGTGKYSDKICDEKCEFTPEILDVIVPEQDLGKNDYTTSLIEDSANPRKYCRVPDQSGCVIVFDYRFVSKSKTDISDQSVIGLDSRKRLEVRAQKDKECGEPVDMLAVILGVIGSILVAGLVMLMIWKLLTSIHDKREYARFEKERSQAKWGKHENPLYKPSTTTFQNPTFGRKSVQLK